MRERIFDWRLPIADVDGDGNVVNCFGGYPPDCSDNEMEYLYWKEGVTFTAPGPFSNLQGTNYWSGTPYGSLEYVLEFAGGYQGAIILDGNVYAMAVRSGDVSAVPVPATVWLFGSGLLGLIGASRRKKAA